MWDRLKRWRHNANPTNYNEEGIPGYGMAIRTRWLLITETFWETEYYNDIFKFEFKINLRVDIFVYIYYANNA